MWLRDLFINAIYNGNITVVRCINAINPKIAQDPSILYIFGSYSVAKWMWYNNQSAVCRSIMAFEYACINNDIAAAQFLYDCIPDAKITPFIFYTVCNRNYLKLAKWLIQHVDFKIDFNELFRMACSYNHLLMAIWLLELYPNMRTDISNKTAIRAYKSVGHSKIKVFNKECPICFDESIDTALACRHAYHNECLNKYAGTNCPICRAPLIIKNFVIIN